MAASSLAYRKSAVPSRNNNLNYYNKFTRTRRFLLVGKWAIMYYNGFLTVAKETNDIFLTE